MTMKYIRKPRRSLLYIPGNNPSNLQNAAIYGADSVLLDLEDAVAVSEKDAARHLVRNTLQTIDFGHVERTVRVNGRDTEYFELDLKCIIPSKPDAIRLPKTNTAEDVLAADRIITELEEQHHLEIGSVKIHAMLETALSILNAYAVASACPRVTALTLGGQDLAADLGIKRTSEGMELLNAKSQVILAARAAGCEAFDTVYTDINDLDGLLKDARFGAGLGFAGKAAIHPSQIRIIHHAYQPEAEEVVKAMRIIRAAKEAEKKGLGVIAVDDKMVDAPVVAQAERTLELARVSGMEVDL